MTYNDCYVEDADNQIDIYILAGDEAAARSITFVEVPAQGDYLPLYNPAAPVPGNFKCALHRTGHRPRTGDQRSRRSHASQQHPVRPAESSTAIPDHPKASAWRRRSRARLGRFAQSSQERPLTS